MKKRFLLQVSLVIALGLSGQALAQQATGVSSDVAPEFPVRSSIGETKEITLPSMSDSGIKDPSPMEMVVSKKAAPSEQLLGRITPEVFYEMADLERGNVFLKLQSQREQLKNDLEKLKATYRQARLDEIEKRENIIRQRVEWMQEQELARQELVERQRENELLAEEADELTKEKQALLAELENKVVVDEETVEKIDVEEILDDVPEEPQEPQEPEILPPPFKILDIKGMKQNLKARLNDDFGRTISAKVGDELEGGYVVKEISSRQVTVEKQGKIFPIFIQDMVAVETPVVEQAEQ